MTSRENTEKTISFSVQAARITKDTLVELFNDFLHKSPKHGKVQYSEIQKKGKLESIEITENNIGDFLKTARKYDIDYALKRDSSTAPPTYHIFFCTGNSENFRKAFAEYAKGMQEKIGEKSVSQVINREQIKENAKIISQSVENNQERHLFKSDIAGR